MKKLLHGEAVAVDDYHSDTDENPAAGAPQKRKRQGRWFLGKLHSGRISNQFPALITVSVYCDNILLSPIEANRISISRTGKECVCFSVTV